MVISIFRCNDGRVRSYVKTRAGEQRRSPAWVTIAREQQTESRALESGGWWPGLGYDQLMIVLVPAWPGSWPPVPALARVSQLEGELWALVSISSRHQGADTGERNKPWQRPQHRDWLFLLSTGLCLSTGLSPPVDAQTLQFCRNRENMRTNQSCCQGKLHLSVWPANVCEYLGLICRIISY